MVFLYFYRLFATYGAAAPEKRVSERKLDTAEMKMLRWKCGVTREERVRNERITETIQVGEISKKREEQEKWVGSPRKYKRRD